MKLYQLTVKKTGLLIARKMSEAEYAVLCKTPQPYSENLKMIDLYTVEEFDVNVRSGENFKPAYIDQGMSAGAAKVAPKKETKGPAAAGQNIDGSESN